MLSVMLLILNLQGGSKCNIYNTETLTARCHIVCIYASPMNLKFTWIESDPLLETKTFMISQQKRRQKSKKNRLKQIFVLNPCHINDYTFHTF